ncbi:MAG: hypothetical protein WCJ39_08530, partial [bacterium]
PAGGNIVAGQAAADLAHFTFSGTGTLNQVTLQRTGISANTDLKNVYLFDGVVRVSDAASVNSSGVVFFNNLNLAIAGTKTLSVKADIDPNCGGTIGVTMTSYNVTGSTTPTTVSLKGNEMYAILANLAGVAFNTNASPLADTTVNAGTNGFVLWSAPVTVGTRTVTLKSMAFQVIGSAPTDALANITLYSNGTKIGTASAVSTLGYITFDMSAAPVTLQTGSTTLEVRGDIVKGSSRTISLALQNVSDFMVTDSQYGVNIASTGIPKAAHNIGINSGKVTVATDPAFNTTTVVGNVTGAVLAQYSFKAYGEDVKISSLDVTPSRSVDNVGLFVNGAQIGNNMSSTGVQQLHFTLNSSLIIPAGQTVIVAVKGDTKALGLGFNNGTYVSVTLNAYGSNAQGMTSQLIIAAGVPSVNITGPTLTVGTGGLTLALNTNFAANQTIVANVQKQKIGSYTIQSNSSEPVHITNLAVTPGGTMSINNLSNMYVAYDNGPVISPINPQAGANNFPVDITLAPNSPMTIDVFADVGNSPSVTVTNTNSPTITPVATLANGTGATASTSTTIAGTATTGQTTTVTINGFPTVLNETNGQTAIQQATALVALINANTSVNGMVVASNVGGTSATVTITAKTAGFVGNNITVTKTVGTGNTATVPTSPMTGGLDTAAQIETYTVGASIAAGNVYTVTINGHAATYTAVTGDTVTTVGNGLRTAINALATGVTATGTTTVIVTSNTAGTAFTVGTSSAAVGAQNTSGTVQVTLGMNATGSTSFASIVPTPNATLAGQTLTVGTGSLSNGSLATSSMTAQYVVGGTTSQLAQWNFKATAGEVVIDEMHFTATNGAASTAPLYSITVGTKTGTFLPLDTTHAVATLAGLDLHIPVSLAGTPVSASVLWNVVDGGLNHENSSSTHTSNVALTYIKYHVGNTTTIADTTTTPSIGTILANLAPSNTMLSVAAIPTISVAQTSNTGLTAGNTPGTKNHLIDVTVTPSASGSINLNSISFTNSFAGGASLDATLPTLNIGTTPISGASCTSAAPIVCTLPSNYTLTGATTFSLYANIAGTLTAGVASVTTSLTSPASFSWSDVNGDNTLTPFTTANTTYLTNNFFSTNSWTIKN